MTKRPSTLSKKRIVLTALEDIKARDIQAIKVDKITSICDWVVIASAESARQTKALARHVQDKLREAGSTIIGTEGEEGAEWILVDAGDVIAHIMQPTARAYYDLEELWGGKSVKMKFDGVAPAAAALARKKAAAKKTPAPAKKAAAKAAKTRRR